VKRRQAFSSLNGALNPFCRPHAIHQSNLLTAQAARAANEQLALISVVVDGTQFDGQPDHIARLLHAMKQAA